MLRAIERHRLTNVFCVPTVWRRLLAAPVAGRARPLVGAALPRLVRHPAARPARRDPGALRGRGLRDLRPDRGRLHPDLLAPDPRTTAPGSPRSASRTRSSTCGSSARTSEELPAGQVGEIVARGPTLMDGYWAMPERTAEAMRDGWLHTGDLGRFDADGCLYVVGRIKDMIVSGGEKIYPLEVERLLRQHPGVADCALVGVPDREWGESVLAVVVAAAGRRDRAGRGLALRARPAGRLQDAPLRRGRRRAAGHDRDRQGPEGGPARALRARSTAVS